MRLTDSLIRWGRTAVKGDPSCSCCTTEEPTSEEAQPAKEAQPAEAQSAEATNES